MPLITLLVNLLSRKNSCLSGPSEPHMPILPCVSSESHISNFSVTLETLWWSRFWIYVEYFEDVPVCHLLKQSVLSYGRPFTQFMRFPEKKWSSRQAGVDLLLLLYKSTGSPVSEIPDLQTTHKEKIRRCLSCFLCSNSLPLIRSTTF